jgi:hypothetical protein
MQAQPQGDAARETPLEQVVGERPRTEAISNVNHDLIQVMSEKLDGIWRYDKYIEDAERENCSECTDLFRRLKAEDQRHGDQLRTEIERHVRQGTFQ